MIQKSLFDLDAKRCFKCGETKPRTDFYKHSAMADGFLGKCIDCTKHDVKQHRQARHDYYLAYDRQRANLPRRIKQRQEYARTLLGSKSRAKALSKQREISPDKYKARNALNNAIRDGRIQRGGCQVCGVCQVEGHHHDYSKPLDVEWLCKKHHTEIHRTN